jgi:hypothetical protein
MTMLSARSVLLLRLLPALLTAGLIAGIARPARAQDLEPPRRRQGYYLSGGTAVGPVKNWDDGDGMSVRPGFKSSLRIGQLITRRLGLGMFLEAMATKKGSVSTGQNSLGVEGNVALVGNLALRASVGLGVLQIKDDSVVDDKQHGQYGAQYGLGLTYDLFPTRSTGSGGFAITPTFDLRTLPGDSAASVAGFIGVEFVWWTGLPRNQLQLPESEAYKK